MNAHPIDATPLVFRSSLSGNRLPMRYAIPPAAPIPAPTIRRDKSFRPLGSAMLPHRLPYPAREHQERAQPDDPRHGALRDRPDAAEVGASAVLAAPDEEHVSDDRIHLRISERFRAERRHGSR